MQNFLLTQTPLKFFSQSLWRDEAFSVLLARHNIWDMLVITARDFNPPLYYLLLKLWMVFFGQSEIAIRSISLIFFSATLYVFYLLLTEVLKIKARRTWPYLLLFVINPFLLYYAFEARMYMMLTFFTALSFYFLLTKKKAPYIASLILGLYTHYMMFFVILIQLISIPKKSTLKQIGIAFLGFIPWLFFVLKYHRFTKEPFWPLPLPVQTLVRIPAIVYSGYDHDFHFYETRIAWLSLFLSVIMIGSFMFFRKRSPKSKYTLQFFLWSFLPITPLMLVSLVNPIYTSRYIIFSVVGLLLLLTILLQRFPPVLRVLVLIPLFIFTLNYNQYQIKNREKADIRSIVHEIKSLAKKNDVLYVTSELDFHVAEYYFGEDHVFIYGKPYDEIPGYVGKVLIPENKIATLLPRYPSYAFILKNDGAGYEIKSAL